AAQQAPAAALGQQEVPYPRAQQGGQDEAAGQQVPHQAGPPPLGGGSGVCGGEGGGLPHHPAPGHFQVVEGSVGAQEEPLGTDDEFHQPQAPEDQKGGEAPE